MKISIQKPVGALGEIWMIEIPVSNDVLSAKDPVKALEGKMYTALRAVDNRLLELNLRLIDHNKIAQGLTPEGLLAVRQCVQMMYDRSMVPDVGPETQPGDRVDAARNLDTANKVERATSALEAALEQVDQGGR